LCFDRSAEASNVEREKLAEQPVTGEREGRLKKNDAESVLDGHCLGEKNGRLEGGGGRAPHGGRKLTALSNKPGIKQPVAANP